MQYKITGYLEADITSSVLDAARYEEIKSAKATCLFALDVEEKFALLLDNFFEFESELLKQAEASAIWPNRDHETSMLGRLALDRRLVNLLTACRLYLDQTDHGISSLYGNPSRELSDVKAFKNDLYDSRWGYRLMEALRNHVQHSGLPVHVIGHNWSRLTGKVVDYGQHTVVPETRPETLAENESFKKSVLTELQTHGKTVDLRQPTREYVSCIVNIHEKIRSVLTVKVARDRSLYESAAAEFSTISGQGVKYPCLIGMDDDGTTKEQVALVTEYLDYYDSLKKRNRVNPELTSVCASNSIQKA